MALIKWDPKRMELEPVRGLRDEIDRLFDEFFQGWWRPLGTDWPGPRLRSLAGSAEFLPNVNLKETEGEYLITAELPGLAKEDIQVSLTEDSVILSGERKLEKESKREAYHYRETSHGSFERVIPLPGQIKTAGAKAQLKDGVLTLVLPKAEETKRKEVSVKVE